MLKLPGSLQSMTWITFFHLLKSRLLWMHFWMRVTMSLIVKEKQRKALYIQKCLPDLGDVLTSLPFFIPGVNSLVVR